MKKRQYLREGRGARPRQLGQMEPRTRFLIVCEGLKTEPNYFRAFPLAHDSVVDVHGIGDNTLSLVKCALEISKKRHYDQVWCVFDRDSFPAQNFNAALEFARQNNIRVAYSNEAFELWYILHFFYLDTAVSRHDYCHRLSQPDCLGHKYEKNSPDIYDELIRRQPAAIRNAKKLLEQYSPQNPVNDKPSTTVHLLVEQLNQLYDG